LIFPAAAISSTVVQPRVTRRPRGCYGLVMQ
jgi:hypothetical protein